MTAPPASAPAPRTLGLAFVLLAVLAVVGGIALWPDAANASARAAAQPPEPVAAFPAELAVALEDLARGALAAMGDAARREATVAGEVATDAMLARAVSPAALASGAGVRWTRDPVARGVLDRLLERSAEALLGAHARDELARLRARDALAFAWVGAGRGEPWYVRVHGEDFAVEWVRTADGTLHGAWRDFARDAARPWLRDRAFPGSR
jgi:hypothetical protein